MAHDIRELVFLLEQEGLDGKTVTFPSKDVPGLVWAMPH